MRILALGLGALLLLGGGTLVVLADLERHAAVQHARESVDELEQRLADARLDKHSLAESLTALRSAIAEQDALLADTDGFFE